MNEGRARRPRRTAAAAAIVACVTFGVVRLAGSRSGGGHGTRGDCFVEFENLPTTGQPRVECVDGDPACDTDADCHNGRCTFAVGVCINQTDVAGCTPPAGGLARVRALPAKYRDLVNGLDLHQSTCAAPGPVVVKTTRRGKRPGKQRLRLVGKAPRGTRPAVDTDVVTLVCRPRPTSEPCPTTTTTVTTSTTTPICPAAACGCTGGVPRTLEFTTTIGAGGCGHLDSAGTPAFLSLACGVLYLGGAGGAPLSASVPDMVPSVANVCCDGTALTLRAASGAEAGTRGCTAAGCVFGSPVPIPNGSHGGTATSACVVSRLGADVTGTADCGAGSATDVKLALAAGIHVTGDLLPKRCSGGARPGAACASDADCDGGTCVNDTGRCADLFNGGTTNAGTPCIGDDDCTNGATCEAGVCDGGAKAGEGCIVDADCPGGGTCRTLIQPCPTCEGNVCRGGPNDGLACTPGNTAVGGAYPTSADCPPLPAAKVADLPITLVLGTGTVTKTAVDNAPDQGSIFCGFCRDKVARTFKQPAVACDPSHRTCIGDAATTCRTNADCPGSSCDGNTDCRAVTDFTSCGQMTSGAFTPIDVATTIVEVGAPAGPLVVGGAAKPATLVSVFCVPPTFNAPFDAAADLAGPGAVALPGELRLK